MFPAQNSIASRRDRGDQMQASTYMQTKAPIPTAPPTRQRLLEATYRLCRDHGLHGATTREIAHAAGVNEVTLFRHFGSKEKLIAALFEQAATAQAAALVSGKPDGDDLETTLRDYAERFNKMLFDHEPLIRTMIGEVRRYPEEARRVISEAARPLRESLAAVLRKAQKSGRARTDLSPTPAVDAFTGMLLSGMLRRTSYKEGLEYSQKEFVETCVQLFLAGVLPRAGKPSAK